VVLANISIRIHCIALIFTAKVSTVGKYQVIQKWERKWVVDGRNIWLFSGLEMIWWPWFGNKWNTTRLLCTLQRWLQKQHFWLVYDRCLVHILTEYWLIWVMLFVGLLIPPGKCYNSTSNHTTTFLFHVLPNNSQTILPLRTLHTMGYWWWWWWWWWYDNNSVTSVREWTTPTKRSLLVVRIESVAWWVWQIPTAVISIFEALLELLLFLSSNSSQLYSRGWVDPLSDPLLLGKSGSARNEPGPLDL
jgi:hypothetical protein